MPIVEYPFYRASTLCGAASWHEEARIKRACARIARAPVFKATHGSQSVPLLNQALSHPLRCEQNRQNDDGALGHLLIERRNS